MPLARRNNNSPGTPLRSTCRKPRSRARIPAGEISVEGITGNKDVELHVGELTIDVVNQGLLPVDASVYAGEVDAEAFGDNNGGLFRSSSKTAEGPYHLHAHVGSGQLALR